MNFSKINRDMIATIKKERIGFYSFPNEDVLSEENFKNRRSTIEKAVILGNGFKHKVKINFYVIGRPYAVNVETTIWAVDEYFVYLKGGRVIPIKSIESVEV